MGHCKDLRTQNVLQILNEAVDLCRSRGLLSCGDLRDEMKLVANVSDIRLGVPQTGTKWHFNKSLATGIELLDEIMM